MSACLILLGDFIMAEILGTVGNDDLVGELGSASILYLV
jgi:hypothetical protein